MVTDAEHRVAWQGVTPTFGATECVDKLAHGFDLM